MTLPEAIVFSTALFVSGSFMIMSLFKAFQNDKIKLIENNEKELRQINNRKDEQIKLYAELSKPKKPVYQFDEEKLKRHLEEKRKEKLSKYAATRLRDENGRFVNEKRK